MIQVTQDFLETVKALLDEATQVYLSHPDKEELIHFRNVIENCETSLQSKQSAL